MKKLLGWFGVISAVAAVACAGGGSDPGSGGAGGEQDLKSTPTGSTSSCGPITTITCQSGFEPTQVGCMQSHVAGATPLGKCVSVDVTKLVGTYELPADAESDLDFFSIELDADSSFSATGGCRPSPGKLSCGAISHITGTWSVAKSGPELGAPAGANQLVLVDSFNQKTTLFYTLTGSKLTLNEQITGGKPSAFSKQ